MKTKRYVPLAGLFIFISACSQPQNSLPTIQTVENSNITNVAYKGSSLSDKVNNLKKRFRNLQAGKSDIIRITQFGDSHSAADFFTGHLRYVLQKKYGDAGIGWITPVKIKGQRHSNVEYKFSDF